MAFKFLRLISGRIKEEEAIVVSAGAGDADKIPALDGTGRLDNSVMPNGIGADTATIEASENLAAGDLVNVFDSGGPKARKADATAEGKEAVGFVLEAVSSAANATVHFEGILSGLTGLTPGARQYLGTTSGARTETAPAGSGNVSQFLGRAVSATEISIEIGDPITVA